MVRNYRKRQRYRSRFLKRFRRSASRKKKFVLSAKRSRRLFSIKHRIKAQYFKSRPKIETKHHTRHYDNTFVASYNDPSVVLPIAAVQIDPNSHALMQGVGDNEYIGSQIDCKSIWFSCDLFTPDLNFDWATTPDPAAGHGRRVYPYQNVDQMRRCRFSVVRLKVAGSLTNPMLPDFLTFGLNAPWQTGWVDVLLDKVFTAQMGVESQIVSIKQSTSNMFTMTDTSYHHISERIVFKGVVDVDPINGSPEVPFRTYVVFVHDGSICARDNAGIVINANWALKNIWTRLYYKDP